MKSHERHQRSSNNIENPAGRAMTSKRSRSAQGENSGGNSNIGRLQQQKPSKLGEGREKGRGPKQHRTEPNPHRPKVHGEQQQQQEQKKLSASQLQHSFKPKPQQVQLQQVQKKSKDVADRNAVVKVAIDFPCLVREMQATPRNPLKQHRISTEQMTFAVDGVPWYELITSSALFDEVDRIFFNLYGVAGKSHAGLQLLGAKRDQHVLLLSCCRSALIQLKAALTVTTGVSVPSRAPRGHQVADAPSPTSISAPLNSFRGAYVLDHQGTWLPLRLRVQDVL